MNQVVSFQRMEDGTREDYGLLDQYEREYLRHACPIRSWHRSASWIIRLAGYPVSRLEHSLQAATRARDDGADDELVVAALIHDIGDELAPYNHAEFAAAIIRPYVRPEVAWIVEQHGLFQTYYYAHHYGGDRNARDKFLDHPLVPGAASVLRANWDQCVLRPRLPLAAADRIRAAATGNLHAGPPTTLATSASPARSAPAAQPAGQLHVETRCRSARRIEYPATSTHAPTRR